MTDIPALSPQPGVLAFLETRRSRPAKTLQAPAPTRDQLLPLLRIAARCPDHGKLEPWRFVVLDRAACLRLADLAEARATEKGLEADQVAKAKSQFAQGHLVVAVIVSPKASDKIPEVEQTLSAGALCQNLVIAALAAGWGANWLTSWLAYDRAFLSAALNAGRQEWVAGFIHIATEGAVPPDRPRPDIDALTTWASA